MGLFKKQHEQVRQPHISDDNGSYMFRRSRTMTGSSSDSVRVVAGTHADLQSDRLKHHTLRKQRRHLSVYLLLILACAGVMLFLVNNFMLSTSVAHTSGIPTANASAYQQAVDSYLSAHPNERFSFSLRNGALLSALQKQYPEVGAVSVEAQPWLQPAKVTINPRIPIASWTIGSTKYFIDTNGVAFQKNYGAEPTLVVKDNTGIDPSGTAAVASERMIRYIGRLVALLKQNGQIVEKIELPPSTSRQVDVKLNGKAYVIKTNLDRDPAGQVADILQAVNYLSRKAINPSYADVRVSSKLYYR